MLNDIANIVENQEKEISDGYARVFVEANCNIYSCGRETSIDKVNQNGSSAIISLCVGACVAYKQASDLKIYVLFRKDGKLNLTVYEADENFSTTDIATMKQQFQEEIGGSNDLFNEKSCGYDRDKSSTRSCL